MPTTLKGLNLVYPPATASDDLFPDISAQLDIWTNLNFASDEPMVQSQSKGADVPNESLLDGPPTQPLPTVDPSNVQSFDFNNFLAGFGIDPFLAPLQPLPEADMTSLSPEVSQASPSSPFSPKETTLAESPAAKRTRTKRAEDDPLTTPVTVAEDKRRRNTAASARFRAKKKERELVMEKRGKELENRVNELERECEGLRRENGWLKGLVVGVTSGNPATVAPSPAETPSTSLETKTEQPETSKKRKRGIGAD